MNESRTKVYKSYNSIILEALFIKYKVSKYYIRQCVSGKIKALIADDIKKDYVIMEKANKETVANLLKTTME
jgi:hypothetical protein